MILEKLEQVFRGHAGKTLIQLYHSLPYPIRWIGFNLRASTLAHIRYSKEFWQEYELIKRIDTAKLPQRFLDDLILERLMLTLQSAKTAPTLAKLWQEYGVCPDQVKNPEDLQQLPILPREPVRVNPKLMLTSNATNLPLIEGHTSGTTGSGMTVWRTPKTIALAMAHTVRNYIWVGFEPLKSVRITMFGQPIVPISQTQPPFWIYNLPERMYMLSGYHLAPKYIRHYADFLSKHNHTFFEAFPSLVATLAQLLQEYDKSLSFEFVGIFTTGEFLEPEDKELIEQVFNTKVFDYYGQSEICGYIHQCEYGNYHVDPLSGILEIVDEFGKPCPPGVEGRMLWTSLLNEAMPFVRYDIGDIGAWSTTQTCPCGRPGALVEPRITRTGDMLILPDGRRFSPRLLNRMLKKFLGFKAAQIIQHSATEIELRLVPSPELKDPQKAAAVSLETLRKQLSGVEVYATISNSLYRTNTNKRPLVVNLEKGRYRIVEEP